MPTHETTPNTATADQAAKAAMDVVPATLFLLRSIAKKHCNSSLSMPQLRALGFIRRYPSITLSALAEHLGLTVSATSRLVDGLVSRGLMARAIPPENRRKVALTVTPSGLEILNSTVSATQAEFAALLAQFTPEQLGSIVQAMDTIRGVLGPWAGEKR